MALPQERTPQEKETLVFPNPEKAREFVERVEGRIRQEEQPGIDRKREAVGSELSTYFEEDGLGVDVVRHPWEHTKAEHEEVQELVDLSFAKDINAALKKAKASSHYPRNLDLFHDVLTGEMYKLLVDNKLNKQDLAWGALFTGMVVVGTLFAILLFFYFYLSV